MDSTSPTRRRLIAATAAGLLATRSRGAALAHDATPSPAGGGGGSLPAMLARAYDPILDGGTGPSTLSTYANVARQLAVRGLRSLDPAMADEDRFSEWADGVDGLYLEDVLLTFTRTDELWETLGVNPADVTQTMVLGDAPQIVRIYRGTFDGDRIRASLAASDYERVETVGGTVLTIGREGEIDLRGGIMSYVLNAYNNIAVVDDAYVVACPYLVDLEAALAVFGGNEATQANSRAVDTLVAAVGEELASATIIDGGGLSVANMPDLGPLGASPPEPTATIAPAAYALFGITPGSMPSRYTDEDTQLQGDNDDIAPRSALIVALHLGSSHEAEVAVPVIEGRLAEGGLPRQRSNVRGVSRAGDGGGRRWRPGREAPVHRRSGRPDLASGPLQPRPGLRLHRVGRPGSGAATPPARRCRSPRCSRPGPGRRPRAG